jgi:hypothetical protein
MSKTTTLASGQITTTDALHVELRDPDEFRATIFIIWPQVSSVVDPRRFGATAGAVARLMATAINIHVRLSRSCAVLRRSVHLQMQDVPQGENTKVG